MDNHLLVIFGASGDLTARKLIPALYNLFRRKMLPGHFAILGISRTDLSDDEFRKKNETSLKSLSGNDTGICQNSSVWFITFLLRHRKGKAMQLPLKGSGNLIKAWNWWQYYFYLATPPSLYKTIATNLGSEGLGDQTSGWKRIILKNLSAATLLQRGTLMPAFCHGSGRNRYTE